MSKHQIEQIFPYLRVRDGNAAIDFYVKAFGAVVDFKLTEPSGKIGHAELLFGPSGTIMLSDEYPEYGIHAPPVDISHIRGCAVHLHVDHVDDITQQAVNAGAKLLMEPKNQFYGERTSKILDPFGHEWILGSQVEDVSREEMQRRFNSMFEKIQESEE